MPSSTSSSSLLAVESTARDRVPDLPYARMWFASLTVVLLALVAAEWGLRRAGYQPQIADGPELWAMQLAQLADDGVAILGTSRAQCGLVPEVFEKATERRVSHLAIPGASMLPVLEALAARTTFHGVAIIEVMPRVEFSSELSYTSRANSYVETASAFEASWARQSDAWLGVGVQQRLSTRVAAFSLLELPRLVWRRVLPPKPSVFVGLDRFASFQTSPAAHASAVMSAGGESLAAAACESSEVLGRIARIESAVQTIQARGGTVVLVCMPASGDVRQSEDRSFPRQDVWNTLCDRTSAIKVHYDDWAPLRGFACPDGSHLKHADAVRFSKALVEIVTARLERVMTVRVRRLPPPAASPVGMQFSSKKS